MSHPRLLTVLTLCCLALTAWLILPLPALAAGPVVNTATDDESDGCASGNCTLREAIAAATAGDTITFAAGLSGQTITLTGGSLSIDKSLTVSGTVPITVSGNNASRVFTIGSSGVVTLARLSIINGKETLSNGGGIHNAGTLTVLNSTLSGNSTRLYGGGIYNSGILTVLNSTLSGNSNYEFAYGGGGITNLGTLTVLNSTISGNSSTSGNGGGIQNSGTLTVLNSTISGNSARYGGGIYNPSSAGTLNLVNTIIANSPSGGDCDNSRTMATNANNLIEDGSCSPALSGDPLLAPLGDYGGDTQTFALLPGSPALDAGNNTTCADPAKVNNLDQRGVTRPQPGGSCDIGAFESRGFTLTPGGGSNQSALINTVFINPLTLTVTSSFTEPVNGGVIIFIGPDSGAGVSGSPLIATISGPSASSGQASRLVTANGAGGNYVVTATARSNLGGPINYNLTNLAPEMAVLGNGAEITDGDATPAPTDHADFGSLVVGQALTHTFTISNSGTGTLNLSSLSLAGADAGDFLITGITTPTTVATTTTTTFRVRFDPTLVGTRTATVTIANNDPDENPYDFAIQGTGLCAPAITVQNAHDSGAGSLRQAIANVCDGGTIDFAADTAIYLNSQLDINKTVTIDGETHAITVSGDSGHDGDRDVRVFQIQSSGVATLSHLSIVSGTTPTGGSSCPTFCGGGIYNGGTLTLLNSTLSGNSAGYGGGIYNDHGTLTVQNSTLSGNSADVFSGGGGGIYNNQGTLTVQNSTLSGNSSTFDGGGIYNNFGTLTVQNSTLSGNPATYYGGGIYNAGTLTVQNSTLSGNLARSGGGIYNRYDTLTTVQNSTLSGNSTNYYGGGIYNDEGTLTVQNSTLSGNSTGDGGGGIYNDDGTLTVQNSTFSGNSNYEFAYGGGGITNLGTLTVLNSTISGNSSTSGNGGGIQNSGTLTVLNSTISGNSARYGGGIYNPSSAGTLNLVNTIIANSPSGGDCDNSRTMATNANNLIEDGSCSPALSGDPLLAPLGDYGGDTQTFALLPGSPALDAGNNTTCADPAKVNNLDQRGVTRPQPGGSCDIGAFESRGFTLTPGGGSNQSALINTVFINPLTLTVTSSFTEPVNGGVIIFIGPDSGAGVSGSPLIATISGPSASSGQASRLVTANGAGGNYVVTATARSNLGGPINYNLTNLAPEMAVLGNGAEITDGDATPAPTDHADFGSLVVGQALTHTFTISNSGTGTLNLSSLSLAGADAGDFLITGITTPTTVATTTTTTFRVRFDPTLVGTRTATVTIANNDPDENPYDFAIQGTGLCAPAITVQNAHDSGAGSLRQAIANVCDGGTIDFAADTAIYLNSQLDINKTVTIDGETHAITVSGDSGHDGDRDVRVFQIQSSGVATLSHLSIVSGTTPTGGSSCPTFCGGGIYNGGTLTLLNSTLSGNSAGYGGGIYNDHGTLTVQNSTLSGNSADVFSGGGGGIYNNQGTLTVQNSTLSGNSSTFDGGGIYNNFGTLTVQNSTLSGNPATYYGGGIYNAGTLTVQNSTLSGNLARSGGGIYNRYDTLTTVQNSTLSGNSTNYYGGGIYNDEGTLTVQNSTLSGNSTGDGGGGIYNDDGTLTVQNSTFSGNSADLGGGIWNSATLSLTNTIIANSPSGGDCRIDGSGSIGTNDHNLIEMTGTDACDLTNGAGGSIIGDDPLLASLGDYGGATQTFALLPGSPAIDAGNNTACANPATSNNLDQRGVARPQGAVCDIGAFESRGFSLTKTGGDNQSTPLNTAFTNPLSLTVSSSYTEPVNGGQVIFTGPGSGAGVSGSPFTVVISGSEAKQPVTANGMGGSYVVTATARGSLGSAISYTLTNLVPEMAVLGNGVTITAGDTTPAAADDTDFGDVAVTGGSLTRTFTISNSGGYTLTLTGSPLISLTGPGAGDFSVTTQPVTPVGPNLTTTFTVRFDPTLTGTRAATVTIAYDDSNENPYTFAIAGAGAIPTVQFTQAVYQINEDSSAAGPAVSLTRTGQLDGESRVQVSFTDNTASGGGVDYTGVPINVTFPAGSTAAQTVTVPISQDLFVEPTESLTLTVTSLSNAQTGSQSQATLQILDDDSAAIVITPTVLTVSEPSGSAVFTINLTSHPTAAVTVTMMVSDLSECTLSRSSAALDAANWQTGVTITVTALDDAAADGPQSCNVVTNAAASADPDYNGQNPANVAVTVNDDDIPGVQVSPLNLTVAEPAGTAVFTVSLATLPTGSAAVTVPLTSTCAVVPASVTIPFAAWDSGVTVTVTALDDEIDNEPERTCAVTTGSPTSPAAEYEALTGGDVADVSVTVTDDDEAGFTVWPASGQTGEDGGVFTFTLRLNSEPAGNVIIDVTSSNPAAGTASPTQLTFTPLTWGRAQTVTVTGQDDGDNPAGDASYTVDLTVNGSTADPAYAVVATAAVTVTNRDNDVPPVYLPLILRGFTSGPDLVIDSLSAGSGGPEVVIRNAGNAPVVDAFWVDVYFNPNQTPSLNHPWPTIAPAGAVWGVTQTLAPDEELTLTVGGAYYDAGRSSASFPAGAQVYGLVDSVNLLTHYGGVQEIDESNNLFGPVDSTAAAGGDSLTGRAGEEISLKGLPKR